MKNRDKTFLRSKRHVVAEKWSGELAVVGKSRFGVLPAHRLDFPLRLNSDKTDFNWLRQRMISCESLLGCPHNPQSPTRRRSHLSTPAVLLHPAPSKRSMTSCRNLVI